MKVKTYGVPGLSEWYGKVKAGNIEVEVQFKGGTASPSGAQPAYFVTKDPITQFVIENSKQFKQGFIILVMQHELPGDHPRIAVPKSKPVAPAGDNGAGAAHETGQEGATGEDAGAPAGDNGGEAAGDHDEAAGEGRQVSDGLTRVEVASLDDAKAYLVEHHGCKASELRSKAKIVATAKEHGIEFIGI
ncbi:MAG: hypothetical protein SPL96_11170 [Bacteroidales bacterium]|nr:hypothetical protein [Bacteroidales bacterium]